MGQRYGLRTKKLSIGPGSLVSAPSLRAPHVQFPRAKLDPPLEHTAPYNNAAEMFVTQGTGPLRGTS